VTIAQPHALIGFLGPRVYEALYDAPFPPMECRSRRTCIAAACWME